MKAVSIGGGTGRSTLLRVLKLHFAEPARPAPYGSPPSAPANSEKPGRGNHRIPQLLASSRLAGWGKLAAFAAILKKGAHLQLAGELRTREYEKEYGNRKKFTVKQRACEIALESILKLDPALRDRKNLLRTSIPPTLPPKRPAGPRASPRGPFPFTIAVVTRGLTGRLSFRIWRWQLVKSFSPTISKHMATFGD